jgi:hypothetical protein
MDKPPYLTLVDPSTSPEHDEEFAPLPYYPWEERPPTLPIDQDEAATAIHLAHTLPGAAALLKVPEFRLNRLVRHSPRLQRILAESFDLALNRAVAVPIDTLFDPQADARRLEWASKLLLNSRLAQNHPLSPAPSQPSAHAASLTLNQPAKTITFRWRTDADDQIDQGFSAQDQGDP